jgi:hypothetical protein
VGTSKEVPANGTTFSEGYTYKFETLAMELVKVTFTVLDTDKPGISNVELFQSFYLYCYDLGFWARVYSNYNRTSCWHRTFFSW